jgi:hypothetical protein
MADEHGRVWLRNMAFSPARNPLNKKHLVYKKFRYIISNGVFEIKFAHWRDFFC